MLFLSLDRGIDVDNTTTRECPFCEHPAAMLVPVPSIWRTLRRKPLDLTCPATDYAGASGLGGEDRCGCTAEDHPRPPDPS